MKTTQNSTLLELHVPDFEKAKDYYGKLGFKVVWERKRGGAKGYLVLKLENNILCFWAGNEQVYKHPYFRKWPRSTKRGYAVEIVLMIKNIEKYYNKVKSFSNVVEEFQLRPWGLRDFRVEDPFGFYIRITEPHDTLNPKYAIP